MLDFTHPGREEASLYSSLVIVVVYLMVDIDLGSSALFLGFGFPTSIVYETLSVALIFSSCLLEQVKVEGILLSSAENENYTFGSDLGANSFSCFLASISSFCLSQSISKPLSTYLPFAIFIILEDSRSESDYSTDLSEINSSLQSFSLFLFFSGLASSSVLLTVVCLGVPGSRKISVQGLSV